MLRSLPRDGSSLSSPPASLVALRVLALATATGVLLALAFAGAGIWPLALIALAPLAVAVDRLPSRRALAAGAWSGFLQNALAFHWIYRALRTFSHLPPIACAALMGVVCAYQGGGLALFAWLLARCRDRGWPRAPVFFLGFAAVELAYPMLLPYELGSCVYRVPALLQAAEVGGPCLVAMILATPAFAFAEVAACRRRREAFPLSAVALGAIAPLVAFLAGTARMQSIDARARASPAVRVGIVQANVASGETAPLARVEKNLALSGDLRGEGVDFIVWSEGAVNAIRETSYARTLVKLFTGDLRVPLVFGAILRGGTGEGPAYNTALSSDVDGAIVGRYDKHVLFPFGEYVPWHLDRAFPVLRRWLPNAGRVVPGEATQALEVAGHKATALICYEDIFPSYVNARVRAEPSEMLVTLSNDAWFSGTDEPWAHLAEAQMRAVEHRRFLLRAANVGVSAVVDPAGRMVALTEPFREAALDVPVRWMRPEATGYEIWGDGPWWVTSAAVVAMAFLRRPRRSR